jgi:hypothetical protein
MLLIKFFLTKLFRAELRHRIIACFKDVSFTKNRFLVNSIVIDVDGEVNFYKAKQINEAIEKLNKILREL